MIFRVGLTGGIGSGKSTVAAIFEALGAEIIDTDVIAHLLTAPGGAAMTAVRDNFGPEVQNSDGSMNRPAMRRRVFADPMAKKTLESILHPMIRQNVDARITSVKTPYAILAIPLLVESGDYIERVDRVLVVDCPEELQIARTMDRSKFNRAEVEAILAAQCPRQERLSYANDIVLNNYTLPPLQKAVAVLHQRYSRLATLPR